MEITLISLDQELYCIGIRLLSAYLRRAGHRVQCIFLARQNDKNVRAPKFQALYSPSLLDEVRSLCADSGLIGLSLMTNQFLQAVNVTEYLKGRGIGAPIIWGGVHPTVAAEACLRYADMVCLGEGEEALLELVDRMEHGRSYLDTRNIWFNSGHGIIRNPLRPLVQELDGLPFPDYECDWHFLLQGDHIEPLRRDRLVGYRGERYRAQEGGIHYPILTSRGCPFACTYCCNSAYQRLYPHERRLRWRSADSVVGELRMVREKIGPLALVSIVDDNFTARTEEELRIFCQRYQAEIAVPFACQCSPLTITAE